MIAVSISVEGQTGLTWPLWKRWVATVENCGFAGLYRSDHFTMPSPPDQDSLECIVSLAYLADHSQRVSFGPLVAPLSFRDPIMLARQAIALDELSGGRMILGIGAGWIKREHTLFGYPLGDRNTQYARWEEGLEVVTRLLRDDEPVTYEGQFYRLQQATLLPRPQFKGGPRILVGGSGRKRTLRLAARYADIWNATFIEPAAFRECSTALDTLLQEEGRDPSEVKRTAAALCFFGSTKDALMRRVQRAKEWDAQLAGLPLETILETLRTDWNAIAGPPEIVIEQIHAYAQAGVEELMLQWFDVDDINGVEILAERILPYL